ncbi:MAG: VWA domain-containing protein, partial [Gemmatimonadales bacterium]|nr:VWA domain-containing protein [Gemmatimonadales bacterium]
MSSSSAAPPAINDDIRTRSNELNSANAFLESVLASVQGGVAVVDVCNSPPQPHLLPVSNTGGPMRRMLRGAAAPLALFLTTAPMLHAQGWIEIERPPAGPVAAQVVRSASVVRVTLDGRIARIEVEERFRNTGASVAEGSYLYPLPGEAVFQNFSLWAGDHELRGEVMTAEQARGIYEEIVRRRKDPALLTLAGHGLVRAQVFPIEPGETRRVVLRYTQLLDRAGDALRLRYAMGNRGRTTDPAAITVTLPASREFGSPYSPTHPIKTRRTGDRTDVSVDATSGGDVELFIPLTGGLVGTTVISHAPGGEDGYYMLLLAPPAASTSAVTLPRDLTLVVDVSGSMSGAKLAQARTALVQALGTLGTGDRFRLIAFSSAVRPFRNGFVPASAENVAAARAFVDRLAADGGTNIAAALDAVLDTPPAEGRLGLVVFMTDGVPSVGEQAPDRLADRAAARRGDTRIFTVGVGHDVNTYLLDRLSAEGHGSAAYVAPDAGVELTMASLLGKLRFPALVNLHVVSAPVRLLDNAPATLPDLFLGEDLVILGRYHG